jgi:hypothetical protein
MMAQAMSSAQDSEASETDEPGANSAWPSRSRKYEGTAARSKRASDGARSFGVSGPLVKAALCRVAVRG